MGKWLKRDLKRRKRINVERKKKRKRPQSKKRNERETRETGVAECVL
jgi:hypothetical protein